MNIFELRRRLIDDYSSYIDGFLAIRDADIQRYVRRELFERGVLWPEPLLQLNPQFWPGHTVDELVDEGLLHPDCARIFRWGKTPEQPGGHLLRLHQHQEEAIRVAAQGHSYVLTTGTGSGKSLAYMVPIADYVLRHPEIPGIKAVVVYPMNALANSQLGELQKYLGLDEKLAAKVRFERYTGQEGPEKRAEINASPPDILLTNYMMLELMLTRQREEKLISSAQLRFLVLDELHTYRGRQGADVALLVRRVRDRMTPPGETLQCVGTSATLAGEGTYEEQCDEVAKMATRVFGVPVSPAHIIGETLQRTTASVDENTDAFRQQLAARVLDGKRKPPEDYEAFVHDPLSIWLESTFGTTLRAGRRVRAKPLRIAGEQSAASLLHDLTDAEESRCVEAIQEGLLAGYESVRHPTTGRSPFAFRLHQFISKGDTVYATLEHSPARHLTLQRQQFAPGGRERVLLPLVFCRECGQEYYCVRWQDEQTLTWRDVQDQLRPTVEAEQGTQRGQKGRKKRGAQQQRTGMPGFLYLNQDVGTNPSCPLGASDVGTAVARPWPVAPEEIDARLPEEWQEADGNGGDKVRLTPFGRKNRPQPLYLRPDGTVIDESEAEETGGVLCYFLPSPFYFCLHCGVSYSSYLHDDFSKLALLSSEGRSTATTILSLSAIRHLDEARARGEEQTIEPKMLSFTDNRQDASLQAGHFNDFVEIVRLRSALYKAAQEAGAAGLRHDSLALRVFDALNLPPEQYAAKKELKYSAKTQTEQALRNVLGYRLYLDLQRGWRITSPNLEQCGLLLIDYQDLPEVCADSELWQECHEALKNAPAALRQEVCRTLLDYMRRELAMKVDYLDAQHQEMMKEQSSQLLLAPWGIDEDERMVFASRVFPRSRGREDDRSARYLSGLSSFGRYVRRTLREFAPTRLKPDDAQTIIEQLLETLSKTILVDEIREGQSSIVGYQLSAAAIIWRAGNGTVAYRDPMRMPTLPTQDAQVTRRINPFFLNFYQNTAAHLDSMQGIQAHEHTAQVPAKRREEREDDFRAGKLRILYCSPTMELGVDIAELNVVNMRNIPPTPANYAQRSGRAGRSGQPALVFSYCSTGSSHDQYFFQHPEQMASGAVAPPRIDLANEDLIRAHMHALWLAETGLSLEQSLKDLLDVSGPSPSLQLLPHVRTAIENPVARQRAQVRGRAILQTLGLSPNDLWYTPNWLGEVLHYAAANFDLACNRWRELYRSSQRQRDVQNSLIGDASLGQREKEQARRLRAEAELQLELLLTVDKLEQSEFYSYRYFASEGFLPGYNFPRLPLSAYIPARRSRQRDDEYLSRPRFLAIAEFAPRAFLYHEGSRYIIHRSILPVREGHENGPDTLTSSAKKCQHCGYMHPLTMQESVEVCAYCGQKLEPKWQLNNLFKLQNVSTRRRDRINSDEEERQRQGYDIRTAIRFIEHKEHPTHFVAHVESDSVPLVKLTYGQAATLWRINLGPLRRADKSVLGFILDTDRGYWGKEDEAADDPDEATLSRNRRVIPYVEDTRNCLLFEPLTTLDERQMIGLQAALKNALQVRYQLEDNELAAEPLPDLHNRRMLLFYEAAEGGAGVLRQLIDDDDALSDVAGIALQLCHYDPHSHTDQHKAERALEPCEAACYNCLMTYANQRDHRNLDRTLIKDFLIQMQRSTTVYQTTSIPPTAPTHSATFAPAPSSSLEDLAHCEVEREWLALLRALECRLPTKAHAPFADGSLTITPDFLYEAEQLAVYVDGPAALYPERPLRDATHIDDLIDRGYIVLRFGEREQWERLLADYPRAFGFGRSG